MAPETSSWRRRHVRSRSGWSRADRRGTVGRVLTPQCTDPADHHKEPYRLRVRGGAEPFVREAVHDHEHHDPEDEQAITMTKRARPQSDRHDGDGNEERHPGTERR